MKISSRYEVPHELAQMEDLVNSLKQFELARWVAEIYFDSSMSICFIDFDDRVADCFPVFR